MPVEGVALGGAEAGVADDAAELFFSRAIVDAGGADYILFKHHRANVVAADPRKVGLVLGGLR